MLNTHALNYDAPCFPGDAIALHKNDQSGCVYGWVHRHRFKPSLVAGVVAIVGASLTGWALPAAAAPQLVFDQITARGDVAACTHRAYRGLQSVGLDDVVVTLPTVTASHEEVAVTVLCHGPQAETFEATVMVAGDSEAVIAEMEDILGGIRTELQSPADGPNAESLADLPLMSDVEFSQFLVGLADSWPEYIDFLAPSVARHYFTAAQASQIVDAVRLGQEEVQVAIMLYPRVVDVHNWHLVEQSVTFGFDRQELRQAIAALD
jgi:hypothetical protein